MMSARDRIKRFGRLGVREPTLRTVSTRAERYRAELEVAVLSATGTTLHATVRDLSVSGFRADLPQALPVGAVARMLFPGGRTKHFRVVRLEGASVAGEFFAPFTDEEFDRVLAGGA
ncbi:PilZ domain-containing protein [Sphingomonas jatrophae]|nr:PilZ domain-containing protein [Sphingomonas jatrophae]